jgi:phosphoserine phosphatase RsbU/P
MCYREAHGGQPAGIIVELFPCAGKRVAIAFGNVWGGDEQTSADASYLRHLIRMLANKRSPAILLECLSLAFSRRVAASEGGRVASLFVAAIDGHRFTYASAGHDFALLIRASGEHHRLPTTGMILGFDAPKHYQERDLTVAPMDWLILVTDGVTAARDATGACFGKTGVVRNAVAAIAARSDDPAAWILEAARDHAAQGWLDDASVLCVRFA